MKRLLKQILPARPRCAPGPQATDRRAPGARRDGFQTLADGTEVLYHMGEYYRPEAARGLRWDDPALAIAWPDCPERTLSPRDLSYPDFVPCAGC